MDLVPVQVRGAGVRYSKARAVYTDGTLRVYDWNRGARLLATYTVTDVESRGALATFQTTESGELTVQRRGCGCGGAGMLAHVALEDLPV